MMDQGLRQGFRLDQVGIDPMGHEVHGSHGIRMLSSRTTDFLMTLAEDPGSVVETVTLLEHLRVESSEGLERCLDELQDALDDSPGDPHYVRRVGEGYQL